MTKSSIFCFWLCLFIIPISSIIPYVTAIPPQDYWPTLEWQTSTPKAQGMSSRKLNQLDNFIESTALNYYIDSFLVIRNGYIVYEHYRTPAQQTTPHHIYSCTKVVTSTLIGMCVDEGNISSLDNTVLDYFPQYTFDGVTPQKESITVQHLLSMSSGLQWFDNSDYYSMASSNNPVEYVLNKSMVHTPGSYWTYNSGGSHVLSCIVNNVSVKGTAYLAEHELFTPLGIEDYTWNTLSGIPNGGTLLYLRSRDMAKIGLLYLNKGNWNGTQIVSEAWVENATSSQITINNPPLPSFPEYGYQWWMFHQENGYSAIGSNSQYILVLPDLNMIVVSTAGGEVVFDTLVNDYVIPAAESNALPWILGSVGGILGIGLAIGGYFLFKHRKRSK